MWCGIECDTNGMVVAAQCNKNSNGEYGHMRPQKDEKDHKQQIESFNNNNNINNTDNINPFNIDMTRMNNSFKIAEYFQNERLVKIIAGRHASLMKI